MESVDLVESVDRVDYEAAAVTSSLADPRLLTDRIDRLSGKDKSLSKADLSCLLRSY